MEKYKNKYRAKSTRLQGYDYEAPGIYFITIVSKGRKMYFGNIENEKMNLSELGKIVYDTWLNIPSRFQNIKLHEFCVMPNHIHGLLEITSEDVNEEEETKNHISTKEKGKKSRGTIYRVSQKEGGITNKANPMLSKTSIPKIIRWYKGRCSFEIRRKFKPSFEWQPKYYDNIIRNEETYEKVQWYIKNNHLKWIEDQENPINI